MTYYLETAEDIKQNKIMKIFFTIFLTILAVVAIVSIFAWATDRVCDKKFSVEFKATQQYKDMQCPESK